MRRNFAQHLPLPPASSLCPMPACIPCDPRRPVWFTQDLRTRSHDDLQCVLATSHLCHFDHYVLQRNWIGQSVSTRNDGDLQAVIVLMRHSVRTPIESETRSNAYNAQAWPAWPTKPGALTPHGAEALHLLGAFYRARYSSLLQNNSCENLGIYVEANTTQRTIASAKALLAGLSIPPLITACRGLT